MAGRAFTTFAMLLGAACAFTPSAASGYVREVTTTGVPVAWKNPCVTMHLFLGAPPPILTGEQLFGASAAAASVWSQPALACSDIRLTVAAEASANVDVARDGKNAIVFRTEPGHWCGTQSASPPDKSCYPSSALAVTTIFKNKNSGEILETDIAFNAVNYNWGDRVGFPSLVTDQTPDFQNALTHELGHVIGLDHTCYSPGDDQRLLDNTGAPQLDCSASPPSVLETTMYPSVQLQDTLRRDLVADDIQGVCDIYPYSHETCPVPVANTESGGCAMLPSNSPGAAQSAEMTTMTILAGGLLLLLFRRAAKRN
jgi:hypothetical protein